MRVPTRSEGTRSGVNWMRRKLPPSTFASVLTVSVLARPGTPSSSTCPPVRTATRTRSSMASCPTITRFISYSAPPRAWRGPTSWLAVSGSVMRGAPWIGKNLYPRLGLHPSIRRKGRLYAELTVDRLPLVTMKRNSLWADREADRDGHEWLAPPPARPRVESEPEGAPEPPSRRRWLVPAASGLASAVLVAALLLVTGVLGGGDDNSNSSATLPAAPAGQQRGGNTD